MDPIFLYEQRLPHSYAETADRWFAPQAERLGVRKNGASPLFVGINGAQGSGKSTLAAYLAYRLEKDFDKRCLVLSIDDFYFSRSQRECLAAQIHPLLKTRGVPGTHDLELALQVFSSLRDGKPTLVPRFDKSIDDPFPTGQWHYQIEPVDVVIFEGWCVGVQPQDPSQLDFALNELEFSQDSFGQWRHFVNKQIFAYQEWFSYLDEQWMLRAPSFDCVHQWRWQQERKLIELTGDIVSGVMNEQQIAVFIQHYQRLTEHALATMPSYADLIFDMLESREIVSVSGSKA